MVIRMDLEGDRVQSSVAAGRSQWKDLSQLNRDYIKRDVNDETAADKKCQFRVEMKNAMLIQQQQQTKKHKDYFAAFCFTLVIILIVTMISFAVAFVIFYAIYPELISASTSTSFDHVTASVVSLPQEVLQQHVSYFTLSYSDCIIITPLNRAISGRAKSGLLYYLF